MQRWKLNWQLWLLAWEESRKRLFPTMIPVGFLTGKEVLKWLWYSYPFRVIAATWVPPPPLALSHHSSQRPQSQQFDLLFKKIYLFFIHSSCWSFYLHFIWCHGAYVVTLYPPGSRLHFLLYLWVNFLWLHLLIHMNCIQKYKSQHFSENTQTALGGKRIRTAINELSFQPFFSLFFSVISTFPRFLLLLKLYLMHCFPNPVVNFTVNTHWDVAFLCDLWWLGS